MSRFCFAIHGEHGGGALHAHGAGRHGDDLGPVAGHLRVRWWNLIAKVPIRELPLPILRGGLVVRQRATPLPPFLRLPPAGTLAG